MAEEAQTELPVQAAEEQPVAEEPVAEEPVAEPAAEPAAETAEPVAEPAAEAELGDAGQKRSRDEEEGADGEEPEAKRSAAEPVVDVSIIVQALRFRKACARLVFVLTGEWRC